MKTPLVSIGLPVYNGERYLQEAADSILDQTLEDFELIICDNASTDRTAEICAALAARDRRVRVFRNPENIGAARNFNRVFELATGRYFKWAAYDDVCRPDLLRRCVEALEEDPQAVLAYPQAATIDEEGRIVGDRPYEPNAALPEPHQRFGEVIACNYSSPAVYGVMRSEVLRRTKLMGAYDGSDLLLLAELALYGPFREVSPQLLLHREHAKRAANLYRTPRERATHFDPSTRGRRIFPRWQALFGYLAGIRRAPLSWRSRIVCLAHLGRWVNWNLPRLIREPFSIAG